MAAARIANRAPRVVALVAVLDVLAGCGGPTSPTPSDAIPTYETIDGQAVGQISDCAALRLTSTRCERAIVNARSLLDEEYPSHAPINNEVLRGDVKSILVDGHWMLSARSGEFVAMVEFDLADGTRRVISVVCGVWQPGDRICDPNVP